MTKLARITHPVRFQILLLLQDMPSPLSKLDDVISISKPEISRYLADLHQEGLVEKEGKNHKLSNYGLVIVNVLSPVNFLFKHQDFLKNCIVDIPVGFLRNLDHLMDAQVINSTGRVMTQIGTIFSSSKTILRLMGNEKFPFEWKTEKAEYIFPKSFLLSPIIEKNDVELFIESQNSFELRSTENMPIILIIADDINGMLLLKDNNGNFDFNTGFYVNDKAGIEFLLSLWSYYWEESTVFDLFELI